MFSLFLPIQKHSLVIMINIHFYLFQLMTNLSEGFYTTDSHNLYPQQTTLK